MRRVGLILVLIGLTASGCLGGGSATPASTASHPTVRTPRDRLAVSVRLGLNTHPPITHHYLLTCDPAGGTMPHPGAACRAISDYLHHNGRGGNCKLLTSATATDTTSIVGTFAHKPVNLRITTGSWCEATRPIVHDYWALSTFPCSTIVDHTQNILPYPRYAHASGCLSSSADTSASLVATVPTSLQINRAAAIRVARAWYGGDPGAAHIQARYFTDEGSSATRLHPVWVVGFIGGRVCVPMLGPPGSPSACATHWLDVVVDAHTGRAIAAGSASSGPFSYRLGAT